MEQHKKAQTQIFMVTEGKKKLSMKNRIVGMDLDLIYSCLIYREKWSQIKLDAEKQASTLEQRGFIK